MTFTLFRTTVSVKILSSPFLIMTENLTLILLLTWLWNWCNLEIDIDMGQTHVSVFLNFSVTIIWPWSDFVNWLSPHSSFHVCPIPYKHLDLLYYFSITDWKFVLGLNLNLALALSPKLDLDLILPLLRPFLCILIIFIIDWLCDLALGFYIYSVSDKILPLILSSVYFYHWLIIWPWPWLLKTHILSLTTILLISIAAWNFYFSPVWPWTWPQVDLSAFQTLVPLWWRTYSIPSATHRCHRSEAALRLRHVDRRESAHVQLEQECLGWWTVWIAKDQHVAIILAAQSGCQVRKHTPSPNRCDIYTTGWLAGASTWPREPATALSPLDDPVGHLVYSLHGVAGRPGSPHVLLQAEAGKVHSRPPEED